MLFIITNPVRADCVNSDCLSTYLNSNDRQDLQSKMEPPPTTNRFETNYKKVLLFVVIGLWIVVDLISARLIPLRTAACREISDYIHHALKTNCSCYEFQGPYQYGFYTNSLGLRDRAVREVPIYSEQYRILFLGDSFVEGFHLDYDETFIGHMDSMLRGDGWEIETLNGGVVSYSPKLYYLQLKRLVDLGLKLDEIIVFIDISDIQDEIVYEEFRPGAPLGWSLRLANMLERNTLSGRLIVPYFDEWLTEGMMMPALTNSPDSKRYWNGIKEYNQVRSKWTYDSETYELWGKRGLELASKNMDKLYEICRLHGLRLTVVVYPWPDQIEHRQRQCVQSDFWKSFTSERNIAFLDLFPLFINSAEPQDVIDRYFIPDDSHWNEEGHRLVADALFQYVTSGHRVKDFAPRVR